MGNVNEQFFDEMWGGEHAIEYLQKSAGARWFRSLLRDLLKEIKYDEIRTVVDLGCGVGLKSMQMAELFPESEVMGTDFADEAIKAANSYWQTKYSNLRFATQDVTDAMFDNKYDIVCMFDVLEHIEDWKEMLDKIMALANKYIVLSFPTGRMRPYEKHIGHYRNFVRGEVEEYVCNNNYTLINYYNAGFPFFSPILRDLTNIFFKEYAQITNNKMSRISIAGHDIYYFLLRYLSFKNTGDMCMLLFKKYEQCEGTTVRKIIIYCCLYSYNFQ